MDKPSQQAEGYSGVTTWNKNFTDSNSNCNKRSQDMFPVPHNLEAYDTDMHDYIFSKVAFCTPFSTNQTGDTITGVNITLSGSIALPSVINGTTITAIGNSAFANQTHMSQISIPASVTNIGSNAFENCASLTNVTLPNNLTSIGNSAFKGCTSLSSITIPNSVTSLGSSLLSGCSSLTNITIPNTVTSIGSIVPGS